MRRSLLSAVLKLGNPEEEREDLAYARIVDLASPKGSFVVCSTFSHWFVHSLITVSLSLMRSNT